MVSAAADTRRECVRAATGIPLSDDQAGWLANILTYWPRRLEHKSGQGRCLPYTEIRDHLRTTGKALATGFFSATGWNHAEHLQRAWTLSPAAEALREALAAIKAPAEPKPEPKTPRGRPRTRAVNRFGKSGNRADDIPQLRRAPELNIELARSTLKARRAELKNETDPETIGRLERVCLDLQTAIDGKLNHDYRQTRTGRLQGQGRHLQGFTREAKAVLLPDCFDIDIENCHPSIIQQLARAHGVDDTPGLDDYLQNKHQWRDNLARHVRVPIKLIKRSLLAVTYGATMTALTDILGEQVTRFTEHQDVIDLHSDLKIVRDTVVKAARANANRLGNIHNVAGVSIHQSEKPAEIMAHIVQGIESEILRTIADIIDRPIELGMHDGLILREALTSDELDSISYQVQKRTGYKISLEQTPINPAWIAKQKHPQDIHRAALPIEQQGGKPNEDAEPPLTTHGYDKALYLLTIEAVNFGFVRDEKQADIDADLTIQGGENNVPDKPPPDG